MRQSRVGRPRPVCPDDAHLHVRACLRGQVELQDARTERNRRERVDRPLTHLGEGEGVGEGVDEGVGEDEDVVEG